MNNMNEEKPDVIYLAGDFFHSGNADISSLRESLALLRNLLDDGQPQDINFIHIPHILLTHDLTERDFHFEQLHIRDVLDVALLNSPHFLDLLPTPHNTALLDSMEDQLPPTVLPSLVTRLMGVAEIFAIRNLPTLPICDPGPLLDERSLFRFKNSNKLKERKLQWQANLNRHQHGAQSRKGRR